MLFNSKQHMNNKKDGLPTFNNCIFSENSSRSIAVLLFRHHLWVFFVQTILADRYIHLREIWVVSLKSSSSAEFETKKIFFSFFFFEEFSRIEFLCEHVRFVHL